MTDQALQQALEHVPSLRGLFVTAMPDCLLFHSWMRKGEQWAGEDVAAYFGDLVRSNRQGLKALGTWSEEMQVTIEAADALLLLREIGTDFVVGFVFDRSAPLGMVRLHVKLVLEALTEQLPSIKPEQRPRAIRIAEFLVRYAPDAHTALQRTALRSGIQLQRLRTPDSLTADEVALFEESVCDILGIDSLKI